MTTTAIIEDIDRLLGTNSTTYPVADKLANANLHFSDVVSLILKSDGRWQWDDNNHTTLPMGTATLVDGQQDYEINGADFLTISAIQVKDVNGYYRQLEIVDFNDAGQDLADLSATSGMPTKAAKRGNSIFLFPKPSSAHVTLSAGIQVFYQRPPSYLASDALSKVPGFNPLFHRILSFGAAIDYAIAKGLDKKLRNIQPRFDALRAGLMDAYARRPRDEQPMLQGSASERTEIY